MSNRKYTKLLVVAVALSIVIVMLVSSFSGAVYYPSASSQSKSNGSHVYLVTTSVGGQNSSYYEEVQGGKVVKTWPASAVSQTTNFNLSNSGTIVPSSPTQDSKNLRSQLNALPSLNSNTSAISANQSNITSLDRASTGSTFNLTQSYTLTSITLSPTSSSLYIGQSINFQGSWLGGTSPFTYLWQVFRSHDNNHNLTYYTGSTTGNGASFSFAPEHSGTYRVLLTVNGTGTGAGLNATSIITVTNNQNGDRHGNDQGSQNYQTGLQSVTLTPTTSVMYTGQPITFVGNWTGSFKAYNYAWEITNSPINWQLYYNEEFKQISRNNTTHATSADFTFNPIYGSYGIYYLYLYLTPTDTNGRNNQGEYLVGYSQIILLPGTPGVTSVTMSPSSVKEEIGASANSDSGVPIAFTGNWSGGTGKYSYAWMVVKKEPISTPYILQMDSYNYTNGNSATFSFAPNDTGQYYVYLFVNSASSPAWVMAVSQVYSRESYEPSVTQVTLTPTTVSAYLGEPLTFNANWTGGVSPYTYAWYVTSNFPHWQRDYRSFSSENTTSLPNANFTYIPSSYGIYYLYLFVKDQNNKLAPVATAEIIVLHPSLPLTSSAISISPTTATVGTPLYATVESGYGIAPFSYSWTVSTSSGQPVPSGYSTSGNQITFSTSGTYDVTVTVMDSSGVSASLTETVTINATLSATAAVYGLSSSSIDMGQSTTLTATSITGGYPPYTGQWLEEPPRVSKYMNLSGPFPATSNDLAASIISTGTLSTVGTWLFELEVTDSSSTVAYSTPISVTVSPQLSVALSSPVTQIDSGNSVTFTNQTQGGTSPFSYSYTVSPTSGWAQSTNPGNTFTFSVPNTYVVTLIVTDAAGASSTSSVTVTVVSPPLISEQPQSYSIDPNQQFIALNSTVEYGSGSYTWQWYSGTTTSGTSISDASGSGTTATFTPTQAGSYYVVFKDSTGQSVISDVAVVTMNSAPSVSVSPSSATIYESQSLLLTATPQGGSGHFSYSWTLGGSRSILGTGTSYTFSESTIGTYTIWLNVTDTGTSPNYALSPIPISITVNAAPTVTISPSTATIDSSQSVVLTPAVSGGSGSYIYSWTIGGSSTVVGSSPTYSFSETTPGTYKVWLNVTDTGTTLQFGITASVPIVVDSNPSITVQPQSATIDSGQSIIVTSTATGGTGSFTWQWYNTSGAVSGASGSGTTASHSFSTAETGVYVKFTDTGTDSSASPSSTATSKPISVTLDAALSITVQPSSGIIDSGQFITLTSTVSGGTGTFTWSLYTSSNNLIATGTGATASHKVSPITTTSYYFLFTDSGTTSGATPTSTITSSSATVTVNSAPTVTVSPSSATLDSSQSLTFASTVDGGSGSFSYSWTVGSSTTVLGTSSTYSFSESTSGTYLLTLTVTDKDTSYVFTATASIMVYTSPSISSQPSSVVIDSGQSITISAIVTGGTGSFSWQWYDSSGAISSESGTGLTAYASFSAADSGIYVVFTDTGTATGASPATAESTSVKIIVDNAPSVSIQPSSSTIESGQSATVTSTVSGGTGTFSWFLYTTSGTLISSSTGSTATYQVSPTSTTSYYFVFVDIGVTSGATPQSSATSNQATVTVNIKPVVSITPSSSTIDIGQSVTLTSTVTGGSGTFTYNWSIGGSTTVWTGSTYNFSEKVAKPYTVWLNVTDTGTTPNYVLVPVKVTITVETTPTVTVSPSSSTIDTHQSISLSSSVVGGSGSFTYAWSVRGNPLGQSTSSSVTFSEATSGNYVVWLNVTDTGTTSPFVFSKTVTVTVKMAPSISTQPTSVTIDSGQSATLSSAATGGTGAFSWTLFSSSGTQVGTGPGPTASYQVSPTSTTSYYFIFMDTGVTHGANPAATAKSDSATVTVENAASVSISPSSAIIDSGQSVTLTSTVTGGSGKFTYNWTIGGSKVSGGTDSSYSFSEISTGIYKVWLNVTDAGTTPSLVLSPVSVKITVDSSLAISSQPSPATIDAGQSITISAIVTGGTGSYSWQWYDSSGAISGDSGTSATATAKLSSADTGIYAVFTDTGTSSSATSPSTVTSSKVGVTVDPSLSILAQPNSVTIDSGQSITLTSTVTGGTGSYSWKLYTSTNAVITTGNTATASYEVSPTSTTSYYFAFIDNGVTSGATPPAKVTSNTVTVTVSSAPAVTISPSPALVDSGQSITLTSDVSGGVGPFAFQWTIGGGTVVVGSGSTYSFSDSIPGKYSVWLNVTDTGTNPNYLFPPVSVKVTVDSSLAISSQPSPATIDAGQSITISAIVTGGTGSYSWQWYDSSGAISGDSGTGHTASATFFSGDTGIYVVFTDTGTSSGQVSPPTVTSNKVSVTEDTALSIVTQPSPFTVDSGQSSTLSSRVTGGTGSYSWFLYTSLGVMVKTGNGASASYSVSPSINTSYYFEFKDTGVTSGAIGDAFATSNTAMITVGSALIPGISPSSATLTKDQSQVFTSTTTGGTGQFSYSWTIGGSTNVVSTTKSYTFSTSSVGSYKLWLNITDTGTTVPYTLSITANVQINPGTLSVTFAYSAPSSGSGSLDIGQSITLSVTPTISGGASPYSYQWYLNTTSQQLTGASGTATSGSAITYSFTPGGMGTYLFYLNITSFDGQSSTSGAITMKVYAVPSISSQPSSVVIDSGQSITISAIVTGGTESYSWQWYDSSGAISSESGTGLTAYASFSAADSGIYVVFTDTGTSSGQVSPPTVTSNKVSVTEDTALSIVTQPTSSSINPGQIASVFSKVSGGTGFYSWILFTSLGVVVTSGNGATASYSSSLTTTTSYYFVFTDTGTTSGATPAPTVKSDTATVTVNSAISVSISPSSATLETGQSQLLTSSVNGGSGQFSYSWTIGGSSAVVGSQSTYSFSGSTAGAYQIWLNVTDTGTTPNYALGPVSVTIKVVEVPMVSMTPSSGTIDADQSIGLSSTVSGGTGTFTYSWSVEGTPVGTKSSYTFSESSPGIYSVMISVTDTGTTTPYVFTVTSSIVVKSQPTVSTQPASVTINSGQSATVTSTVSGGTGTFSWSLYTTSGSLIASSTGSTATYQVSPTSTTSYYFVFVDIGVTSGATPQSSATSNQATVTVNIKAVVSITPSSSTIDIGQSITLVPSISGGSGSFAYLWSIGGSPTTVGSKSSYSFTGTSANTYKIYLNVTDNNTHYVTSSSATVVVNRALSISIQPTSASIDNGQSVTMTSSASGGTGTFSWFLFTGARTPVASGTGATASYTFKPQSNSSYYFIFTDIGVTSGASPSSSAKSKSASVVVYPDPTVTVLPTTVGSGSTTTLTATASAGSGVGYSFEWYSDPGLTTLVYSGNPFTTPKLTSTTTYYVTVKDSTGFVSTPASVVVTVVGSLTSSSISISPTTTDVGYVISASVSTGAGVSPYSYSWTVTLYPSGSASGDYTTSGNRATFTTAGVYSVTITVEDSTGKVASLTKTVTVNNLPSVNISPSTVTIDANSSITFSNSTSGGTGTMTYGWGYPGSAGITRSGNTLTFQNTGSFTIKLYFNDSLGASGFASSVVTVNTQPVIVYSSLNVTVSAPSIMDSGTATNIAITSVSGTGPYAAQLKEESPGSTTYSVVATTNQFSTLPENINTGTLTAIGQWHFVVTVTEVSNTGIFGTSSPITVTVVSPPTSSAISISPITTEVGNPITATMQSGYGTSPFTYVWSVTLSGGSASGDYSASGKQVTFNTAGTYSATVTITDADGISASNVATITVNSQLSVTLSSITPTIIDKGQTVTFSNSVAGGLSPYTISYSVSSIGIGIKIGAYSVSGNVITFSLTGEYAVTSTVTDSLGKTVFSSNSITVTVNALPTVTLTASATSIDTGMSVTFTNTTANGTQPYTYIWSYQSAQGINQSGNNFTFQDTGNFTITLTIVDAVGVVASSSVLITVNPSPIIVLQPGHSLNQQTSPQLAQGYSALAHEQKKTLMHSKERQ